MLELIIDQNEEEKRIIALVENGKLVEQYEEDKQTNRNEGNIYVGKIKDIVSGMQSAFIDIGTEKNAFIHLKDILPKIDETIKGNQDKRHIKDVIHVNDTLLVQVKKDSNEKKGARVSTHINLPSQYVVLMPNTNIITISQKIEEEKERERLLNLVKENLPKGNGIIIRTSAMGKTEELIKDIKKVLKQWEPIQKAYEEKNETSPKLIYKASDIVEKMILDLNQKGLEKIFCNTKNVYDSIKEMMESQLEFSNISISLSAGSLLDKYEISQQIEKNRNRKVWLHCGGFITIDQTEALTAIDVNTGKYTGKNDLEDTIYKVNQEATIEIVKQLRLRDIGGIIIIDYIDMKKEENKNKIERLLKEELKSDRAKTQIEGFTKLDLMEMTRKHICSHKN